MLIHNVRAWGGGRARRTPLEARLVADPQGAFIRTLDANDRVAMPAPLAECKAYVLAPGFDNCIRAYQQKQWDHFQHKLDDLDPDDPDCADFIRFFASMTTKVALDKSDRLHLPEALMKWAGIGADSREVQLYDAGEFVELWEVGHFNEYMSAKATTFKQLARAMFGKGRPQGATADAAAPSASDGAAGS